jgi:hypothetical protein
MFQVFRLVIAYIAMAIHVCFECFRLKLQVFQLNVAKVDLNVAYVTMAVLHVSNACFNYFVCFKRMLRVFNLDVSKVDFRRSTCCNGVVLLLLGPPYVLKVC